MLRMNAAMADQRRPHWQILALDLHLAVALRREARRALARELDCPRFGDPRWWAGVEAQIAYCWRARRNLEQIVRELQVRLAEAE
jgi:hypothetical protein